MTPGTEKVNLTVSDPVSADIQAICAAVQAVCEVLKTPEGQASMAAWRESSAAFNAAISKAGTWLQNLFAGKM